MAFTKLTPSAFASLSPQEQQNYQTQEAQDIRTRLADPNQQQDVTASEVDFADRVLGRNIGSVPDTGYISNILESEATGLTSVAKGIGTFSESTGSVIGNTLAKGLWPIAILGIIAAVILFYVAKIKE
jgi:hypothetical protein